MATSKWRRLSLGMFIGIILFIVGFLAGNAGKVKLTDRDFAKIKPGMKAGEALCKVLEGKGLFVEKDPDGDGELWCFWNVNSFKALKAKLWGSYPFTLHVDEHGTITRCGYEYNTRFD